MQLTLQQAAALRQILDAILSAIRAAGDDGAPAGVLYAGLMSQGCNLSQFESLMGVLVRAGKVRRAGDLYYAKEAK